MCSVQFYSSFCRWSAWNWPFPYSVSKAVQQINARSRCHWIFYLHYAFRRLLKSHRIQVGHQFDPFSFWSLSTTLHIFSLSQQSCGEKDITYWEYRIKTQVPSSMFCHITFDFKSWCRCGICSVQFHSSFCSKWNQHQTTFSSFLMQTCSVGQHPGFKTTAMYSVVSCASR